MMDDVTTTVILALSRLPYAIGFLALAFAIVYIVMVLGQLKPGVRPWLDAPLLNPVNHIFFSSNLTEAGLKYRRRVLFATGTFLFIWCAGIGLDTISSRLTSRSSSPASPAAERPSH